MKSQSSYRIKNGRMTACAETRSSTHVYVASARPYPSRMVRKEALRGYVLEEFIARLVKDSGFDLLVHDSQDSFALTMKSNELNIFGRGAEHQVDVLGQLRAQIPLTYPLRIFIEAKFRKGKTGLPTLRNALGVLNDVNEHYSWRAANQASITDRYDYRYAIFSTSGFTDDAVQYAITQRLSLGDLSTPVFRWLLDAADSTAAAVLDLAKRHGISKIRIREVRTALRQALGTMPTGLPLSKRRHGLPRAELRDIAEAAAERIDNALYVAFATDSPFIVFLQPDEVEDARDFLNARVARRGGNNLTVARARPSEWLVTTEGAREAMTLRLAIPEGFARWVLAEPTRGEPGDPGGVAGARLSRSRSLLVALTGGDLSEVAFEPVRLGRRAQTSETQAKDESWQRPDLAYHDGDAAGEPVGSTWSLEAFRELLRTLRRERAVQAAVIEAAARQHGQISRREVYEVTGYESSRSLKGFTRPARRITKLLIRRDLLPTDAKWPLHALYAGRSVRATHFVVPTEFSLFVRQLDNR